MVVLGDRAGAAALNGTVDLWEHERTAWCGLSTSESADKWVCATRVSREVQGSKHHVGSPGRASNPLCVQPPHPACGCSDGAGLTERSTGTRRYRAPQGQGVGYPRVCDYTANSALNFLCAFLYNKMSEKEHNYILCMIAYYHNFLLISYFIKYIVAMVVQGIKK